MLKILINESDIKKAQQQFVNNFEPFTDKNIFVKIGHRGLTFEKNVSWCSKLGFWVFSEISGKQYWNAFGIKKNKPREGSHVSITCEINFPLSGINRRIGGAFAEDSTGGVFIVHRGKIGGGKKGIGKSLFVGNYRGKWISVEDGDIESTVAPIGAVNSIHFTKQVKEFVREVNRIKGLIASRQPQVEVLRDEHGFVEEFFGKKQYKIGKSIEADCDHGLIVNNLASALQSRGFNVANDKNHDLYIVNEDKKISSIFEIKTHLALSSLYLAVGQLLLGSVSLAHRPRLILTIPQISEKMARSLKSKLKKLGIELLIFKWRGDKAIFPELDSLNL